MRIVMACSIALLLFTQLPGEVVNGPIGAELDEFLSSHAENGFYGALVVARGGEVLLAKGYGWADRDSQVPATEDTAFSTGSITKQFTAAAILKLEEQGKLHTGDLMADHFEDVPEDKRGITLHHLLTHTAGFPGAIGDDYAEVRRDEFVRLAMATPLGSRPGERYEYSNVGFSLLAAIVEQESGGSYERFLNEHLFEPAGMTQTGYRIPRFERLAHGYRAGLDWGTMLDQKWDEDGPYWHLRGNGGIVATPMDMFRWYLALRDGKVLSPGSTQRLFAPHTPEGQGAKTFYGYGWSIADTRWGKLITHNGGNGIFRAELQWFVEPDVFVYICSSRSDRAAFPLVGRVDRIVMQEEGAVIAQVVSLPESPAGRLAKQLIDIVQTGQSEAFLKFIEAHFEPGLQERIPPERHERMFGMLQKDLEGGTIRAAKETPELLEVLLETAQSRWLRMGFQLAGDPGQPQIKGLMIDLMPEHEAMSLIEEMGPSPQAQASTGRTSRDWGLPQSETGRRGSQLLNAIHQASDQVIEQFLASAVSPTLLERRSADELKNMLLRLHRDLGDFDLAGAGKTGPNSARLHLETARGTASVSYDLEADPPHRIESMGVELGSDRGTAGADVSFDDYEGLDRFLQQETDEGRFSGVVLMGKGDQVEFQRAYGLANKRFQIPNRTETRFNVGSLNKLFTSVAVLQLLEKGLLGLDDPIGRYLDGFPKAVADRVTVRHLLRHESGWGAYWDNPEFIAQRTRLRKVSDYLEFIRSIPLGFEPGSRQEYSNTGFEVLGALVEKASGQDYYDYVRTNIYEPAGMQDSGSFEIDMTVANLATGYTNQSPHGPREGFVRENSQLLSVRGTPAGGGYSTGEDLWRFSQALMSQKLLSAAYTNFLLSGFEDLSPGAMDVGTAYAGGAPGVNAILELETGPRHVTVVLSNYDPPTAGRVARTIREQMP